MAKIIDGTATAAELLIDVAGQLKMTQLKHPDFTAGLAIVQVILHFNFHLVTIVRKRVEPV